MKTKTKIRRHGTKKRRRSRVAGKKANICYIEPTYKLNRKTDIYDKNYKIIDGSRVYYTKYFNLNPHSKEILDEYKRENPSKCINFAKMEDHLLNQHVKAINHFNKFKNCKVGDKLSYKVTILSNKMTHKLNRHFPHHQVLINNTLQCME